MLQILPKLRSLTGRVAGFTMIELLIVITILGILAVAVLSAINPIEQIRRGRDTSSQSDAEQMINASERYNAFQGYYPWQMNEADVTALTRLATITTLTASLGDSTNCPIVQKLSVVPSPSGTCRGTEELKLSFINRITDVDNRPLFIYNRGTTGDSTYVCFVPQSQAFAQQAADRCDSGLPDDLAGAQPTVCNSDPQLICLP